jgi:hypothetical protein
MAVAPLASKADVQKVLGRDLTSEENARYEAILDKASELFRTASGQQFTEGTSDVELRVTDDEVRLPQRPVTAVASVTDQYGLAVAFDRFKSKLVVRGCAGIVRVSYSHGGAVPDSVRLCIAEIVAKVLTIDPKAKAGLTQYSESAGPFNESSTYATWAQGGQTMLAPADEQFARTFNIRLGAGTIAQRA